MTPMLRGTDDPVPLVHITKQIIEEVSHNA